MTFSLSLQAELMFVNIRELQPRSGGGGTGLSVQERARSALSEIWDKMPEGFEISEVCC